MTLRREIKTILDAKVKYKHNRVTVLGISDDVPDYSVVIDALLALFRQKALECLPKKRKLNKDNPQYVFGWNVAVELAENNIAEAFGEEK